MYTCGECGWTGDRPDEGALDLYDYVQGCEGRPVCIPIGTCPGRNGVDDEDYTCGAPIFEPTALAEFDLIPEMLAVLERLYFQHRDIGPTAIKVIGKARRLGWSPHRMRTSIDLNLKG